MNDVNIYVETDTRSPRGQDRTLCVRAGDGNKERDPDGYRDRMHGKCNRETPGPGGHISGHGPDHGRCRVTIYTDSDYLQTCIPAGLAAWMAGTGMEECKGAGYQKRGSVEPDPVYGR